MRGTVPCGEKRVDNEFDVTVQSFSLRLDSGAVLVGKVIFVAIG